MIHKEHRTLLVADGAGTGDYENRIKRLKESVNGTNIKCDLAVSTPTGDIVPDNGVTISVTELDVVERFRKALNEAKEAGYTQLLFSAATGS